MYPKCVPDVSKVVVIYEAAFFLSRGGGGWGYLLKEYSKKGGRNSESKMEENYDKSCNELS